MTCQLASLCHRLLLTCDSLYLVRRSCECPWLGGYRCWGSSEWAPQCAGDDGTDPGQSDTETKKKIEHSTTISSMWYLYNYSSSYFEIPVKPGVPNTTSIHLYPDSSVAHPSASATRLYLDVYDGCRYVDETSMTWICKRKS